jgi:hypothetical protein
MPRLPIVLFFVVATAYPCLAQDILGTWIGPPGAGKTVHWVLHVSKDRQGQLTGEIWREQTGAVALPIDSPSWDGAKLSFFAKLSATGAVSFEGVLSDDGNWIDRWMNGPLKLERVPHLRNHKAGPDQPVKGALASTATATPPPPPLTMLQTSESESSEVLSRALGKLAGTSQRLLKYACVETVERSYYNEPAPKLGAHPMSEATAESCDGRKFGAEGHLRLDATDRLRLQVAVSNGKEIFSWAAASRFDSRTVFEMISAGPMSTGSFGPELVSIFENSGVRFTFTGRRIEKEQELFRYNFAVPLASSRSSVRGSTGWILIGYHGWIEIDPDGNLVRLTRETDITPPETRMCRYRSATEYGYKQVGNADFLLPGQSAFDVLKRDGGKTRSVTEFSNCHEYTAESTLAFGQESPVAAAATPREAAPLPPGISLTLALLAPIDTATAAAGDAVSAKVTKAVRAPGTQQILVDAGATVHGRITEMRHQYKPSQFQYAFRFETIEQRGAVAPLAIELERTAKAEPTRSRKALATRGSEFTLPPRSSPAETGGRFTAPAGDGRYIVPAGSESNWVTVAQ